MANDKKRVKQNVLFIGNPGVGKSTLLNCYMKDIQHSIDKNDFFKSGLSVGKGLTYKLDTRTLGNRTFMDTPGLEDIRMRKEAASAITEALRYNGYYKVVFVVTLEAGRVRTVDSATMNLVLNNAPEITHFGLIVNKLSLRLYDTLQDDNQKKALMEEIMLQIDRNEDSSYNFQKPIPLPLLLKKIDNLDDYDNAIAQIPDLEEFMTNLPPISINKENVDDIPGDTTLEAMVKKLEVKLSELKADNDKLHEQIAKDREQFQIKLDDMIENEHRRHKEELDELRRYHDEVVQKEQEARKKHVAFLVTENSKAHSELLNHVTKEIDENKQEVSKQLNLQKQFYEEKLTVQKCEHEKDNEELKALKQKISEKEDNYKAFKERSSTGKSFWFKVKAFITGTKEQAQNNT